MNPEAADWWTRAVRAFQSANVLLAAGDMDRAGSTAYYAAFYAVSALFTLEDEDRPFHKHSAVRAAVHRELVNTGRWSSELGSSYSHLFDLRITGDYGAGEHVNEEQARRSIEMGRAILERVREETPEPLPPIG